MIAVDTNILVYAHRPNMPFHSKAKEIVEGLAQGLEPWAIPWPTVHEFLAVVTNPRIFSEPTPTSEALLQVTFWLASPVARPIAEGKSYLPIFQNLLERAEISGSKIHDGRIVAICLSNGVERLLSADRDFSRYGSNLRITNPFL